MSEESRGEAGEHGPISGIQQVMLPSGKVIDVIYYAADDAANGAPGEARDRPHSPDPSRLHVCPRCSRHLVYPVDWEEHGPTDWEVDLRCPACEWLHTGVFSQADVERFDVELDRGTEELARNLSVLARANMADDVERIAKALEEDGIQPFDFNI